MAISVEGGNALQCIQATDLSIQFVIVIVLLRFFVIVIICILCGQQAVSSFNRGVACKLAEFH